MSQLEDAIASVMSTLAQWGLKDGTMQHYRNCYSQMLAFQKQQKLECDPEVIVNAYVAWKRRQVEQGQFQKGRFSQHRRAADLLLDLLRTDELHWTYYYEKVELNACFDALLKGFLESAHSRYGNSSMKWGVRKFFSWLLREGHGDLGSVGIAQLQRFIGYCTGHMTNVGVREAVVSLKRLYRYLKESGVSEQSHEEFLSLPIPVPKKVLPPTPQKEVAATLDAIDTNTPNGKRDYAMILLGAVTGLRAGDITQLKLSNIDWANGELHIVQSKTGRSLSLPLTADVGRAVRDYILNARPKTTASEVFITTLAPYRALSSGSTLVGIHGRRRSYVGLPPGGFHGLRRMAAHNMVVSGVPFTDVSQALGHAQIDVTKLYAHWDVENMGQCALGFQGIEPIGVYGA